MANVIFDEILGKLRSAEVSGGTGGGADIIGGFGISVADSTVSMARYRNIETVTGNSVTMQAGHAYKITATSSAVTLNTETVPANQFGLEGHLEIFVAGTGYVVTGTNVVLSQPLEPDSVNNCTVRFHDGLAIISVEDHVAGYIVVNGNTSGDGSLYYGITTSTNDYVAFDASLNGSTLDMAGAVTNGEKHVVGNGYADTILTGGVSCTSKTTFANLAMQGVSVLDGTAILGDVYIPNGATVAVSGGGGLAVEKVTGNGGVIDLGGTHLTTSNGATVSASGCIFTGGAAGGNFGGVFFLISSSVVSATSCVFSGNNGGGNGGAIYLRGGAQVFLDGCTFANNAATSGMAIYAVSPVSIKDCVFSSGQTVLIRETTLTISGENTIESILWTTAPGTVTILGGASINLTSSINPGGTGGITVLTGGCTVNGNAIAAGTYTSIDSTGTTT